MAKINWGSALGGALAGSVGNFIPQLKPFSAALSAGAGALANKKDRIGGALTGFAAGGLGSAATNWAQNRGAAGSFGTGMNNFIGSVPGFGGFGTNSPTGVFSKALNQFTGFGGTKTPTPAAATSAAPATWGQTSSPMEQFRSAAGQDSMLQKAINSQFNSSPVTAGVPNSGVSSTLMSNNTSGGSIPQKSLLNRNVFGGASNLPQATVANMLPAMGMSALSGFVPGPKYVDPTGTDSYKAMKNAYMNPTWGDQDVKTYIDQTLAGRNKINAQASIEAQAAKSRQLADEQLATMKRDWASSGAGANYENNSALQKMGTNFYDKYNLSEQQMRANMQLEEDKLNAQLEQDAVRLAQNTSDTQKQQLYQMAALDDSILQDRYGYDAAKAQQLRDIVARMSALAAQPYTQPTLNLSSFIA